MGAGATMGSCMRRLPFHPEDGLGPKSITLTPEMAKHNRRVNSPQKVALPKNLKKHLTPVLTLSFGGYREGESVTAPFHEYQCRRLRQVLFCFYKENYC